MFFGSLLHVQGNIKLSTVLKIPWNAAVCTRIPFLKYHSFILHDSLPSNQPLNKSKRLAPIMPKSLSSFTARHKELEQYYST